MENNTPNKNQTPTEEAAGKALQRSEAVMKRRNLADTTFGKRAVGNDKAMSQLRVNRLVTRTLIRLERYLDQCDHEDKKTGLLK
jgi:hypothetical protein